MYLKSLDDTLKLKQGARVPNRKELRLVSQIVKSQLTDRGPFVSHLGTDSDGIPITMSRNGWVLTVKELTGTSTSGDTNSLS